MTTTSEPREIRMGDRVRWREETRDGGAIYRGGKVTGFEHQWGDFVVIWTQPNGAACVIERKRLEHDAR